MIEDKRLKQLDEEMLDRLDDEYETLVNMVATIRDGFIDIDAVSEYVGYDISAEVVGYPTLALYYVGVYLKIIEEERK